MRSMVKPLFLHRPMDWTAIWFIRNNGENLMFQWLPFTITWSVSIKMLKKSHLVRLHL